MRKERPKLPIRQAARGNVENQVPDLEHVDNASLEIGCDRIVETVCPNLGEYFGVTTEDDKSDDDSGDEICSDDSVPNFSSSSDDDDDGDDGDDGDDEDEEEEEYDNVIVPSRHPVTSANDLICLGKSFNCAADFKKSLLQYSLKTEYDIKMYISTAKRVAAVCSAKDCPWRVYCSFDKSKNKLVIKIYINEHVCDRSGYSKMLKTTTIAQLFEEDMRVNPDLTPNEMVSEIKRQYNLNVTPDQCSKAKAKVFDKRRAIHGEQFARLWDYQKEILTSNPGSNMDIETVPGAELGQQRFFRLYVCFDALKTAWKQTCRPIVGLDGAFLKWDIKGELLSAVGRDGGNRIFPIAWAVVNVEDEDNWAWFIKHLKADLELSEGDHITIISDKQKVSVIIYGLLHSYNKCCSTIVPLNAPMVITGISKSCK